ncbi:MAG: L,D-transpeptidase [Minicystis sp.]
MLGFLGAAALGGGVAYSSGCRNEPPPGPSVEVPPRVSSLPAPSGNARTTPASTTNAVASAAPTASASASAAAADKPYTGPLLGALMLQTPIFAKPEFSKKELGYIRLGGKVPVEPGVIKDTTGKCSAGWYKLVDGGYVCGRYATLDFKSPQIKLGITSPALEDVLPYKYAHNSAHGTPLYRSVPSREDMLKYEPYLEAAKKAKRKADKEKADKDKGDEASSDEPQTDTAAEKPEGLAKADSLGLLDADAGAPEEKPWWQQAAEKGKPIKVKLDDLSQDADGTLAKRMVKGFFVAVDKTFAWNNRAWYKTTQGLVAPADRMYLVKPYTTQGMDFVEGVKQIGFVLVKSASKFEYDAEAKTVKVNGSVPKFTAVGLTGATMEHQGKAYRQTSEGWWMRASDGTYTDPGPKPADLGPNEKWIDVNLTRKTLVAFEGDKPVFAALVSPGKKSKDKEKNHATIQGTFRIREKHIAVTMDGDGKAASDLPYSIEDVPYVQYFEGSYAIHAAFWHNNFGHDMSHGCVNMSPLDAKRVFLWSEPKLPRGWHAAWSTPENRGTLVVVHE